MKAVLSQSLSTYRDERYSVIDEDTGEIIDDAQAYGYKTKQGAYKAYSYKYGNKNKYKVYEEILEILSNNQKLYDYYGTELWYAFKDGLDVTTKDLKAMIRSITSLDKYTLRDVKYCLENKDRIEKALRKRDR